MLNVVKSQSCLPGFPLPLAGELKRMRKGMVELVDLLSFQRPHDSAGEKAFVRDWLLPRLRDAGVLPSVDWFGNVWVHIDAPAGAPSGPCVLWSCHVDTMHDARKDGRQNVMWCDDGRTIKLAKGKPGMCLGADDGAGVWLLLQMVRAGVPGGYVFHRGEERGRLGSEYVATNEPERLGDYDACVAFDRRDYDNLITHQMGERCVSDLFASGFIEAVNMGGMQYAPDDSGSYTDSYSYAGIVSECANVSIGYDREHGPNETLDALHLWRLSKAMVSFDASGLICERDPSTFGDWYGGGWGNVTTMGTGASAAVDASQGRPVPKADRDALLELVTRYPAATCDLLLTYGLGQDELFDAMTEGELSEALCVGGGWYPN